MPRNVKTAEISFFLIATFSTILGGISEGDLWDVRGENITFIAITVKELYAKPKIKVGG